MALEARRHKLHDLKAALDGAGVYTPATVDEFVKLYLTGPGRDTLDPLLDGCVQSTSKSRRR
jgi:type I restriction enzyme, R subunit